MPTGTEIAKLTAQCSHMIGEVAAEKAPLRMAIDAVQAAAENRYNTVPSDFDAILSSTGFTPVELQVAQFRKLNRLLDLGRDDETIREALISAPAFVWDRPLVPVTLCWTQSNLATSMESYLAALQLMHGDNLSVSSSLDPAGVYLPEGAPEFIPNRLWWEVMYCDANRDKAPNQVPAATAAGVQVFAAACQHKAHLRRMNGSDIPYWDVPGLRIDLPGKSGPYAPDVYGCSDGDVDVSLARADDAGSSYAEVLVLGELQN